IELIVDRITPTADKRSRLTEGIETALREGRGVVSTIVGDGDADENRPTTYGSALACPECGVSLPELEPRLFSFNSPHGACPTCRGVGTVTSVAEDLVVPDGALSIRGGAIAALATDDDEAVAKPTAADLAPLAAHFRFSLDTPWRDLP